MQEGRLGKQPCELPMALLVPVVSSGSSKEGWFLYTLLAFLFRCEQELAYGAALAPVWCLQLSSPVPKELTLSMEILADILLLGFSPLPLPLWSTGAESPCKTLLQFFSSWVCSVLSSQHVETV